MYSWVVPPKKWDSRFCGTPSRYEYELKVEADNMVTSSYFGYFFHLETYDSFPLKMSSYAVTN